MKGVKRAGIAMFIVLLAVSNVFADYYLEGYKYPSETVRSGVWEQVKNSNGDLIGEGFSFPLQHRNKIFYCSNTKFTAFGPGQAKNYYNRVKNSTKHSSFWLDKIKKGEPFGLRAQNLRIWNQEKKKYDFIDVEFTVDYWYKPKGYKRKFSPIVCFYHSPVPKISMSGLYSLTLTQKIYKAGTKTPFRIKSNTTYTDIDNGQGITATNTKSVRMAKNTRCKMKGRMSSPSFYNPVDKYYPSGDIRNNVGISYDNSSMKLRFFDLNATTGKTTDRCNWETIWSSNRYTYFSAGGVVTLLPPNARPTISVSREYNGSPTTEKFNHYAGRKTTLVAKFHDKDRDNLKSWYKLYKNGKLIKTGETKYHGYYTERKIDAPTAPGDYVIRWYTQDYKMEETKVTRRSYHFRILRPVRIWSDYNHTSAWERKRTLFNYYFFDKKYRCPMQFGDFLDSGKTVRARAQNVFWCGEEIGIDASVCGADAKSIDLEMVLPDGVKQPVSLTKGQYGRWSGKWLVPEYLKNKAKESPQKIYPSYKANIVIKDLDYLGNEIEKTMNIQRDGADLPIILDDTVSYETLHLT